MVGNNYKSLVFYILVLIVCIIVMYKNNPSFPYAMIVYGKGRLLLCISSILFIFLGLFLKVQNSRKADFISIIELGLLLSSFTLILSIEYDYISSIYHQSTPDLKLFSENLLSIIDLLCIPLSWFIGLPEQFKSINKVFIVLAGLYPTILLFCGLQIKRFVK